MSRAALGERSGVHVRSEMLSRHQSRAIEEEKGDRFDTAWKSRDGDALSFHVVRMGHRSPCLSSKRVAAGSWVDSELPCGKGLDMEVTGAQEFYGANKS